MTELFKIELYLLHLENHFVTSVMTVHQWLPQKNLRWFSVLKTCHRRTSVNKSKINDNSLHQKLLTQIGVI